MKANILSTCILLTAVGGVVLVSGCVVEPNGQLAFAAPVYVAPQPVYVAPQPVVVEADVVPDTYVWDGVEFVGFVGDQYFYLGPGNIWLACDRDRLERFHGWERYHADWQEHANRNDRYRNDAHGHYHPSRQGGSENHGHSDRGDQR
jgi:hypothetical protein